MTIEVGDYVVKRQGDYNYDGIVVAVFPKLDGKSLRYVVEDARGMLTILSIIQINEHHHRGTGLAAAKTSVSRTISGPLLETVRFNLATIQHTAEELERRIGHLNSKAEEIVKLTKETQELLDDQRLKPHV